MREQQQQLRSREESAMKNLLIDEKREEENKMKRIRKKQTMHLKVRERNEGEFETLVFA